VDLKIGNGQFLKINLLLLLGVIIFFTPKAALSQNRDYTVEVAVLRSWECAMQMTRSLAGRGLDAYLMKVGESDSENYYRVRIGRFQSLDVARTYAEALLDSGLFESCSIAFFESPANQTGKPGMDKDASLNILNAAMSVSCPLILPSGNANRVPGSTEKLINILGKKKWLLEGSLDFIYSVPADTSVPTPPTTPTALPEKSSSKSNMEDVVLLIRSISGNRWRMDSNIAQLLSSATPSKSSRPANGATQGSIESTISSSLSSFQAVSNSIRTIIKPTLENSSAVTPPLTIVNAGINPIPEIRRPGGNNPVRGASNTAPPKLQGVVEMIDGRLLMRVRNLDQQKSFSGIARVTLSDEKQLSEVPPQAIALQPNEEVAIPVDETRMSSGEWMLMVYDERQAVRLIRSAPFGNRPVTNTPPRPVPTPAGSEDENGVWKLTEAPAENSAPGRLPNVTGTFDATGSGAGANQAGDKTANSDKPQITIAPRQLGISAEAITMELEVNSTQPLNYVKVSLKSGKYQDERLTVLSTNNGRIPFLVPVSAASEDYSYEIKDEKNNVLASGSGFFTNFPKDRTTEQLPEIN
jgi:SPOR domain